MSVPEHLKNLDAALGRALERIDAEIAAEEESR